MPLDAAADRTVSVAENGHFAALIHHLPDHERAIFSERHLEAMRESCSRMKWGNHPINIRLSVPLPFRRFYFVMIAGPERRSAERRKEERKRHPLWKIGNFLFLTLFFILGIYAAVYLEKLFFIGYSKFLLN